MTASGFFIANLASSDDRPICIRRPWKKRTLYWCWTAKIFLTHNIETFSFVLSLSLFSHSLSVSASVSCGLRGGGWRMCINDWRNRRGVQGYRCHFTFWFIVLATVPLETWSVQLQKKKKQKREREKKKDFFLRRTPVFAKRNAFVNSTKTQSAMHDIKMWDAISAFLTEKKRGKI